MDRRLSEPLMEKTLESIFTVRMYHRVCTVRNFSEAEFWGTELVRRRYFLYADDIALTEVPAKYSVAEVYNPLLLSNQSISLQTTFYSNFVRNTKLDRK